MCGQQFTESVLTTGNAFELATVIAADPETVAGVNILIVIFTPWESFILLNLDQNWTWVYA